MTGWNRERLAGRASGFALGTFVAAAAASCSVGSPSGINNQPQATGSSAGNATSSQAATPAPVAHLGDTVAIRGNGQEQLSVQLVKIVDPAAGADEFTQPDAGKHFVAVQFKLTNSGHVAYSDAPDNDVKVLDAQGQSFGSAIFDTTAGPGFASGQVNIAPGATQLGFITFQVPDGDKPTKVQFTTDSGFGQTGEWLVP